MGKFNIGDSVWFPFDNGKKEQKGKIENTIHYVTFEDDYLIRGNVDGKIYTKHESELSMIAPHKRWLDTTEYKLEKQLEKWKPVVSNIDYSSMYPGIPVDCKTNIPLDPSDTYSYLSDYFNNSYSWGIAHPIKLFGDIPDNNSVIKLDFDVDILKEDTMNKKMTIKTVTYKREIKDIIFSGPATVIKFNNQFDKEEKTVVKCQNGDEFDKTKGFLLALVKEFVDKKSWNNILRIIDSFEEEKNEKEKSIAEIFDSLPENVKNDIYVEIERASRPTRKFSGQDIVKLSKSNTGYIIERCRWNEDKKCWEYFCNNGRDYCRWYEEDRLVFA